jgi:hypothetical protein
MCACMCMYMCVQGLHRVEIPGDGACFYTALARALDASVTAQDVRTFLISFVSDNTAFFNELCRTPELHEDGGTEQLLEMLRNPAEYGGTAVLFSACALLFRRYLTG